MGTVQEVWKQRKEVELQEDYIKQEEKQNTVQGNTASAKTEPRDGRRVVS